MGLFWERWNWFGKQTLREQQQTTESRQASRPASSLSSMANPLGEPKEPLETIEERPNENLKEFHELDIDPDLIRKRRERRGL